MNTFQLNSQQSKNDSNCFSIKESITSIEQFCKELNTNLEKKKKDKDELYKMYDIYKFEELLMCIENLEELIVETENKITNVKKVIWEMRGRILFGN